MVESLTNGHVDGFCVGAPWNSVAVDSGIGRILHFGCEIQARMTEKVFAVRQRWASENRETLAALVRALAAAADFVEDHDNIATVSTTVARRLDVDPALVVRALTGNMKVSPDGATRANSRYIIIGRNGAARPDPVQAAWIYAQIVRWGQAPLQDELRAAAQSVFRPDLYDAAVGGTPPLGDGEPRDGIGGFVGADFDPQDIAGHLASWRLRTPGRPRLSLVR
jgi:NitT/TauT family transport system ATP-binding protein